ncbi:MAG TPA: DNA alkylation repair protein [Thermoanaerobaculia bacterium]
MKKSRERPPASRSRQSAAAASARLRSLGNPKRARASAWFFKTGAGEYGEGDRFLGLDAATMHREARTFRDFPLGEIEKLLDSPWHEERLVALLVLVGSYERAPREERERIFRFYLAHTSRVNNWDLVDASAPRIVGAHLGPKGGALRRRLARSQNLWERRIAIVSTLASIRAGELAATFETARLLLSDGHDLIHKAAGWMLREAGKRDPAALRRFLAANGEKMPRTMLRYAIERFDPEERRGWMSRGGRGLRAPARESSIRS